MNEINNITLSSEIIAKYIIDYGFNIQKREIDLIGNINEGILQSFSRKLSLLESISNEDITVNIQSNGGNIESGNTIIEMMLNSKCKIITKGYSSICSMAFLIFIAGEKRIISRFSTIMFHEAYYTFGNSPIKGSYIKDYIKQSEFERIEMFKWLASRTKNDFNYWKSLYYSKDDRYYTPQEAINNGIAHEILKKESIVKSNKKKVNKYDLNMQKVIKIITKDIIK
jgi:ATP-dependent Clp protease protease subunit